MKLVFFCGSLEPGKDGVGDYTRRLAAALVQQGHLVKLIALHDYFVQQKSQELLKNIQEPIEIIRYPASEKIDNNIEALKQDLVHFSADWLSFQYVPFAYHKKGLPFFLAKALAKLSISAKWHFMFHELWVGMDQQSSLKMKFWGDVQKLMIKKMLNAVKPSAISTQNNLYLAYLKKMGYSAELLPLFGNIKVEKKQPPTVSPLKIAVFGGIHFGAKIDAFTNWLLEKKEEAEFHFMGGNGPEKDIWIEILKKKGFSYKVLGWMEDQELSAALLNCKWGLSSTPYYLSGKSGSIAAMQEHGLTVFCIARNWTPRNIQLSNLSLEDATLNWHKDLAVKDKMKRNTVETSKTVKIAKRFLQQLQNK